MRSRARLAAVAASLARTKNTIYIPTRVINGWPAMTTTVDRAAFYDNDCTVILLVVEGRFLIKYCSFWQLWKALLSLSPGTGLPLSALLLVELL